MLMVNSNGKFYKKKYAMSLQFLALWAQGETFRSGEVLKPRWVEFNLTGYIDFTEHKCLPLLEPVGFAYSLNKNVDPCWPYPNINRRTWISGAKNGRRHMNWGFK